MSRRTCAGSLPDNIQLIQTNSSSINNRISEQENHLIQFPDETILNENNNSIQTNVNNIKQHRKRSSKKSNFIYLFN